MRVGLRARVGPVVIHQGVHRPRYSNERQARWGRRVGIWCLLTILYTWILGDPLDASLTALGSIIVWNLVGKLYDSLRTVP